MSKIYLAGHMLTTGAQMQRNMEKREISEVAPKAEFYVPQDNKEINDKANATQEGLAERIVRHDTDAILWSDTIIIEPLPEALGTHVELGQIKGMKDVAGLIRDAMLSAPTAEKACIAASDIIHHILNQRVYPHYEDISRLAGAT
ncbi:UNVERIFIED_CONTAM: nucleoside 2-deoxyribosyltransferase, partial [Kocuria sp. CPCC 205274]